MGTSRAAALKRAAAEAKPKLKVRQPPPPLSSKLKAENGTALTCQYQRAGWRVPCGATLAMGHTPVRFTGRVLRDTREHAAGTVAVWCQKCKRASEYEIKRREPPAETEDDEKAA